MRLPRLLLPIAGLIVISSLVGCIPQEKYDDLMTAYRSKEQQVLVLQGDLDSARANEEALRQQLASAAADLDSMRAMLDGSGGNLDEMRSKYEALLARINNQKDMLGPELTSALTDLANQYSDVLEFDAKRGMLRFKSDVTFDSGSDVLSSKAQEVLRKVATVLNSGPASNLEVKVIGHTDTQPLVRTKDKFKTNVHLSAYRAISVRDGLVHDGVTAPRFQIAGYGEFRPLVTNGPKGARENRRVEIFLTPLTVNLAELPQGSETSPMTATPVKTRSTTTQPKTTANEEPTK